MSSIIAQEPILMLVESRAYCKLKTFIVAGNELKARYRGFKTKPKTSKCATRLIDRVESEINIVEHVSNTD